MVDFIIPSENQGQIVTRSYACDEKGIYRRTNDASYLTQTIEFAPWNAWSDQPECDFQNGPPLDPDLGDWEEVFEI